MSQKPTAPQSSKAKQFLYGGISGMAATMVVQPIDLIKTRMQLAGDGASTAYKNSFQAVTSIVKQEGMGVYKGLCETNSHQLFFTGLSAGLLRQVIEKNCC